VIGRNEASFSQNAKPLFLESLPALLEVNGVVELVYEENVIADSRRITSEAAGIRLADRRLVTRPRQSLRQPHRSLSTLPD